MAVPLRAYKYHIICLAFLAFGFSSDTFAWGHDGHGAIGILAVSQLNADTRARLESLIGPIDELSLIEACNWPDAVRETEEWEWSSPNHYINIQPGKSSYQAARDCPDQLCATEAIKRYADILGNQQTEQEQRWQAFAWLCHVTGDLHQPLHVGFVSDHGGNEFEITFNEEKINLHGFWDRTLIKSHDQDWKGLVYLLNQYPTVEPANNWSPDMVNDWTNESHQLTRQEVYPQNPEISREYAEKSWAIMQARMATGASRLASIINTVLQSK